MVSSEFILAKNKAYALYWWSKVECGHGSGAGDEDTLRRHAMGITWKETHLASGPPGDSLGEVSFELGLINRYY